MNETSFMDTTCAVVSLKFPENIALKYGLAAAKTALCAEICCPWASSRMSQSMFSSRRDANPLKTSSARPILLRFCGYLERKITH